MHKNDDPGGFKGLKVTAVIAALTTHCRKEAEKKGENNLQDRQPTADLQPFDWKVTLEPQHRPEISNSHAVA